MQRIRVKGLQHLPLLLHLPSYCRTFCCPKQTTVSSLDNTGAWTLCFFMNERSLESSLVSLSDYLECRNRRRVQAQERGRVVSVCFPHRGDMTCQVLGLRNDRGTTSKKKRSFTPYSVSRTFEQRHHTTAEMSGL